MAKDCFRMSAVDVVEVCDRSLAWQVTIADAVAEAVVVLPNEEVRAR
jgi:hypothetical protein